MDSKSVVDPEFSIKIPQCPIHWNVLIQLNLGRIYLQQESCEHLLRALPEILNGDITQEDDLHIDAMSEKAYILCQFMNQYLFHCNGKLQANIHVYQQQLSKLQGRKKYLSSERKEQHSKVKALLEETRQMDKLLDAYERMHKKEKNDHLNDIVDAGVRPVLLKQVVHQEKLDEERQARILREKEIITNRIESRKQRLHEEQHLSMQRKKLRNDMAVVIQQFFIGAIRRKQMKHNILLRKSCTKIQAQIRTCLARTIVNNRIAEIENTKKQERDAIAAKNRKIRDAMALKLKCEQDALDSAELYMKSTKDLLDIIHIAIARQVKHKQCIESVYMKFTNEFGIIDRLSFRCTLGKLGILASRGDIRKVMRLMLSKLPNIENHRLTLSIKEFTTIFDLNIDVDDVASSISSANSKFLDDSYNEGFIDSGIILPALPILRRMKESIQESIRNKFELNLTGRTEYSIVEVFDMVETTWNSPQLDYLHFSKFIHSYDPSFNRNEIAQLTTIFDETLSGTISTNGFLKFILADYKTSNNTSLYPLITVKLRTVLLNTLQNGQDMSTTIDQILLAADTDTVSANHLLLGFQGLHIPFSTLEVVQFLLHFENANLQYSCHRIRSWLLQSEATF